MTDTVERDAVRLRRHTLTIVLWILAIAVWVLPWQRWL
jgi:hypothetical protein